MDLIPDHDRRKPAFREKFLYYLKKNSNPKLLLKLMKVSRYFWFREFPFLVIKDLTNIFEEWQYFLFEKNWYFVNNLQDIDLNKLEKPLWITNKFEIRNNYFKKTGIASQLIPKLAVCQLKELFLDNQIFTMTEFKFLVASKSVEQFTFYYSQVKYADESIVPFDECVKLMPNLKYFLWLSSDEMPFKVTEHTTKNLIAYLNPSILTRFELFGITEAFDFNLFVEFMHKHPSIRFELDFEGPPISDTYSKMLQDYVNKLVESGEYKTRRIGVYFRGQNEKYETILEEHYHS